MDMPVATYFQSLLETPHEKIGVRAGVNCEDRSLRNRSKKKLVEERSSKQGLIRHRLRQSHYKHFTMLL